MSQHDMNIANQGFPAFRSDLNDALGALVSNNSGASAPATTFANMPWFDTTNNIFKIRNADNDGWINIFTVNQTTDAITAIGSVTLADIVSLTGTQTLTNKTLTSPTLTNPTVDKINTGVSGAIIGAGNSSLMKNRIINGAMVIDQRNNGASVTPANGAYTLDRWAASGSVASKYSVQQNAGSVTPPVGFVNYLGITSLSAYTVGASETFNFQQRIEGFNTADLAWGTANAKSVTVSFWVRSSLIGTFGGALRNGGLDRSYPFTYTISVANTWEYKTITVAGDTTGTWLTANNIGMYLIFGIGVGSTASGTAGVWASANYQSATGATSVVGTNGATFYITGVQLEVGSSATGFEYVNYQTSLANCQRYYYKAQATGTSGYFGLGQVASGGTAVALLVPFPVTMRTNPTALEQSGTATDYRLSQASTSLVACSAVPTYLNTTNIWAGAVTFTASTLGGTAGQASFGATAAGLAGYLAWSAEL